MQEMVAEARRRAKRRRRSRRRSRRRRKRKRKTYLRSGSSVAALAVVKTTLFSPLAPATPIVSPAQPPSRLLRLLPAQTFPAQTRESGGLPGGGLFWGWWRQPRGATRATRR